MGSFPNEKGRPPGVLVPLPEPLHQESGSSDGLPAWERRLKNFLSSVSDAAYRRALAILCLVLITTVGLIAITGTTHEWSEPRLWSFAGDSVSILEYAWRLVNGQKPHLDFFTYIGVAPYAMVALGMWISSLSEY